MVELTQFEEVCAYCDGTGKHNKQNVEINEQLNTYKRAWFDTMDTNFKLKHKISKLEKQLSLVT